MAKAKRSSEAPEIHWSGNTGASEQEEISPAKAQSAEADIVTSRPIYLDFYLRKDD